MASSPSYLHAIVIPLMSQSHLIPMIDLSKLLAQQGFVITVVVTPLNSLRYKSTINRATSSGLNIRLVSLDFPCEEAGLPKGCENLDTLPSPDLQKKFLLASSLLQAPLENYLEKLDPSASCIISSLPWTKDVAYKFNIPRYAYHGISCFTLVCSHNIVLHKVYEKVQSDNDPYFVPDIPDKIEFTNAQQPKMMRRGSISDGIDMKDLQQFKQAELSAEGLLVNTFEEMESDYVKSYQEVMRNVFCVGPLSLCNKETNDKFDRGNIASIDKHHCLTWLDSMKPSSVIYVCFGSLCHLLPKQLAELGMGLEASNHPFIWVIREVDYKGEIVEWLLNEKFEARVKGRGLIIKGWAPQVLILSHQATGGFLTHCGWNSTLEGVSAGVPMITWPMFAEQFYNEKLIVQVLKIGVRVGVEVAMQWGEEQGNGVYVMKEDVKNAIDQLMNEGEEGKARRVRAQKLGDGAKKATGEGGSSHTNIKYFIQHVKQQLRHRNSLM